MSLYGIMVELEKAYWIGAEPDGIHWQSIIKIL